MVWSSCEMWKMCAEKVDFCLYFSGFFPPQIFWASERTRHSNFIKLWCWKKTMHIFLPSHHKPYEGPTDMDIWQEKFPITDELGWFIKKNIMNKITLWFLLGYDNKIWNPGLTFHCLRRLFPWVYQDNRMSQIDEYLEVWDRRQCGRTTKGKK